jgi:hypothetical protein
MNNKKAKRVPMTRAQDIVDVTSEDSFPASDPPSWTPVVGPGSPHRVADRRRVVTPAGRGEVRAPRPQTRRRGDGDQRADGAR